MDELNKISQLKQRGGLKISQKCRFFKLKPKNKVQQLHENK
jgi:hypothetical protein